MFFFSASLSLVEMLCRLRIILICQILNLFIFCCFIYCQRPKGKKFHLNFGFEKCPILMCFFYIFVCFYSNIVFFLSKLLCLLKINKIKTKLFVKNEGNARPYIYMIAYHATSEIGFSLWFCGIENSSRELKIIPTYLKRYRLGCNAKSQVDWYQANFEVGEKTTTTVRIKIWNGLNLQTCLIHVITINKIMERRVKLHK